ncbi:kinase-like domain-containing protein, partial [Amanita rubescens]
FSYHFAAPELFGFCPECAHPDCHGCGEQIRTKTMPTDVYAYGCLYYAMFFDVKPFHGMNHYQIMRSVTSGLRPERLENPRLEDDAWNLIQSCWKAGPSERPTMEQILQTRLVELFLIEIVN